MKTIRPILEIETCSPRHCEKCSHLIFNRQLGLSLWCDVFRVQLKCEEHNTGQYLVLRDSNCIQAERRESFNANGGL